MAAERVPRILAVDDNPTNLRQVAAVFEAEGLSISLAEGGEAALAQVEAELPNVVLLDLRMPGMDGMEVLARLKAVAPQLPVIMLTSYGEVQSAVEAIRRGAEDFLVRPIPNDRLVLSVRQALERRQLRTEVESLRRMVGRQGYLARLNSSNPAMREVVDAIRQVAASNFTVLIRGETGTGKELVARAIHQESARADKPFVAIDSGAIPEALIESELFGHEKGAFSGADRRKEGHFQIANTGTLFLDEVSNLPMASQPKLLRAIQERQIRAVGSSRAQAVDVRVIAASNADLNEQINRGSFRQDLYFRLAEFVISVPPLRERREDIVPLARAFVEEARAELKRPASLLTDAATSLLEAYDWPGNIRQLRNVMRRAALQSSGVAIDAADLKAMLSEENGAGEHHAAGLALQVSSPPPSALATGSLRDIAKTAVEEAEKRAIVAALRATQGHKQKAARLLKTDYKTLFVKLKRYGLGNIRDPAQ